MLNHKPLPHGASTAAMIKDYFSIKKAFEKALAKVHARYMHKLAAIKEAITKAGCPHPIEAVQEYRWEHDNGYGRQTWNVGLECRLCRGKNPWPGMSTLWNKPDD